MVQEALKLDQENLTQTVSVFEEIVHTNVDLLFAQFLIYNSCYSPHVDLSI
jgi:hypothetical protein